MFSINSAHPSEWQEIPTKKIRMKEIAAGFAHIVFLSGFFSELFFFNAC